jgi:capsular polysaccharide biosynthesis protein
MTLSSKVESWIAASAHKILVVLSRTGSRPNRQSTLNTVENFSVPGLSRHEEVISYPLRPGKSTNHAGGLIDGKTYELLDEAVLVANKKPRQELPSLTPDDLRILPYLEDTILYGGIVYNHFGHFLIESICRLWAYDYFKKYNLKIGFYAPWGKPRYLYRNNFVNQVFRGFNIPLDKIYFLDRPLRLKQVIVPSQRYGFDHLGQPDHEFLEFIRSFHFDFGLPKAFAGAEKIYVSRSKLPISAGRPVASEIFEKYLAANGYQILHPEQYTLYQQLSILKNAQKIIFCDGSAVHSCILIPDLTAQVAVISRRRDPLQRNYRDTTAQFRGYGKSILWIDTIIDQYQLGMEPWDALSYVDWHETSCMLKQNGFVETIFSDFLDKMKLIKNELKVYVKEISNHPKFIDFLIEQKEKIS